MMKFCLCFLVLAFLYAETSGTTKVAVTGAAGRTGSLLLSKLLKSSDFSPVAIVRSSTSVSPLTKLGAKKENIIVADVTDVGALKEVFKGVDKVVLCTSAVPKIQPLSIAVSIFYKVFSFLGKKVSPTFTFPEKGSPYEVDWLGAKNQIDAAKAAGVKQFVFLSSMGGTQPDNFLNSIGKKEGDELSGNILLWKRKAESYLISSGIPYTIVHPGGLLDKAGGEREIIFGVDDNILKSTTRSLPRADVAEVLLQSLRQRKALKRSFDIASKEPSKDVSPTTNWEKFFSQPGNCKY